jgi:hypothetical protein
VVLFKRNQRHRASLPKKYSSIPNIHIDIGSMASSDMSYMMAADIYLGDVSSQVYEFLVEPRPCIFLNGHNVTWQRNPHYLHWNLGQVVNHVPTELKPALQSAFTAQEQFLELQKQTFAYTYHSEPGITAAQRGAEAIARSIYK